MWFLTVFTKPTTIHSVRKVLVRKLLIKKIRSIWKLKNSIPGKSKKKNRTT